MFLVEGQQAVVGDDDHRVHIFAEPVQPFLGVAAAGVGLKAEGPADHGDGQGAAFLGDLGHHGGGAGAGAAAHSHGDKDHIAAAHGLLNFGAGFLGRLAADFGLGAGAEAPGQVAAQGDAVMDVAARQMLGVGIERIVLNHRQLILVHPAHRIGAAAAHAHYLDERHAAADFGKQTVFVAEAAGGFP